MDESLKARLIGAAVLVALAVLLIPELLSGRKTAEPQPVDPTTGRGTRTFTIELNGEPGSASVPSPPVTEAPAPAPVAAQPPERNAPEIESKPAAVEQAAADDAPSVRADTVPEATAALAQDAAATTVSAAPASVAVPTPTSAASVPRGGWAVQVGAFGSADAARRLVKDLQGAGYRAYLSPVDRAGKTLHRVRVGPEVERDAANRVAERLKGRGLPAAVVATD